MVLEQLEVHMKKTINLDTKLTPFTKITSKCVITLSSSNFCYKLPEENKEFGFGGVFRYNTKSIRKVNTKD